ncbi:excinuclease ABC subunit UvrC [Chondromyces apiculatus]|uniref:UvrABC system protein C n=1 Tax=Chondromyces apiculatus DSM 436 TaxID=1192034 RepID=A0A017SYT0_9BACT|nr:excinuclease ABC subunit UvrC [Chondromyces apiculatus]EYF02129.1 Excinuclease ABC subunit C [Chondromyces apiculatus DSM 436]
MSTEGTKQERTEGTDREALIEAKLGSLPVKPGCYLFIDKTGAVIYVGKAKSLRSRVRSYFQEGGSDNRYFIPILRRIVADLETVVTATEKEAAVLENQLIKQHQPRFNVKLRDDKDFLWLRIDPRKEWPMLEAVRRPLPDKADKARYFGPYHSASSARRTQHLVNKHFQLRTCSDAEMVARRRPCLQYQIKRCLAPCVYEVDRPIYAEMVRSVSMFLEGRHDELTGMLTQRMKDASRDLNFELAAIYRDQLRAVEAVREEQRVVTSRDVDQDVVGLYREGSLVEVELLLVRRGRLTDTLSFSLRNMELPDEEVLAGFLNEYHGAAPDLPDEIVLPALPEGADGIAELLTEQRGRKVVLLAPQRGPRVDLVKMAMENAAHAFREKQRSSDDLESRLEELRERLRLPTLPRRIECCDISHLGGGDTVGSIVALTDGQPDKKRYRSFRVKSTADGDDYGAMYEVLARRFRRGKAARDRANAPLTERTDSTVGESAEGEGVAPAVVSVEEMPVEELLAEDLETEEGADGESGEEEPEEEDTDSAATSGVTAGTAAMRLAEGAPSEPSATAAPPSLLAVPAGDAAPVVRRLPLVDAALLAEASAQADAPGAAPPSTPAPAAGSEWDLPDLLVVDGGRGQLQVALSAAHDLGLHGLPIVGLAKERETVTGEKMVDRVYLPGQKNGIPLRSTSSALFFLARARDEAHRFANHARKRLGKARRLRSELEDIPGIGAATRKALLRELGSMEALRKATDAQILAVSGVSRRHLTALRKVIPVPTSGATS